MPSKDVLHELRSVCQSPTFQKSGEAVRLLRYLVETEQAGQAEKLREVLIGCGLYGRVASYDPKLDAVVRVNATRLRTRLEEHYIANPASSLHIILPKGSYVPVYERREVLEPLLETAQAVSVELPLAAPLPVPEVLASEVHPQAVPHLPVNLRGFGIALSVAALCLVAAVWWKAHTQQAIAGTSWMSRPFSRMGGVEQFPEFSPDGRSVVFAWARSEAEPSVLYQQDLSSDIPHALTGKQRVETRPAWSMDGNNLAFVEPLGDGSKRIIVRAMPSGTETIVATLRGRDAPWLCGNPKLSWAPRGKELFTSAAIPHEATAGDTGREERCEIVAIDVAQKTLRVVTQSPPDTQGDLEATVSPDGQTVAFLRDVSYGVVDVYLAEAGGGPARRITFNNREIMGLAWRPDGRALILAARDEDGTVRLSERDLKTGATTLLTDGTAPAAFPAIARSASQIVFTSYRSTANIHLVSPTKDVELIADQSLKATPELSPDGKRLAYTSDRTGFAEVWISDADGQNAVRLTHTAGTGAQHPFWLPDSWSVFFECRDQQHSQVCLVPADGGSGVRRLTNAASDQVLPSLSRDGRFLYYSSNRTGKWEAYRQAMPDGEAVQLTSGGADHAIESWDGQSIYIETKKDGAGFLIVPASASKVETSQAEANHAYVKPELRSLQEAAWNAGPGGIVFSRPTKDGNAIVQFDEHTGKQVVRELRASDRIESLSVGPDGQSIVYATKPRRSGELDLLTNVSKR